MASTQRERNNIARMKCYEKQLLLKHSLMYEFFATGHHETTTKHITYHWSKVPEDELFNAGYIHDFNKWRMRKKLNAKLEGTQKSA